MQQILRAISILAAYGALIASAEANDLARIEVFPASLKLVGPRSRMQLVVTGHYADGSVRDLTRDSQFATTAADVVAVENTVALPRKDGKAKIAVIAGGQTAVVPVEVARYTEKVPLSFEIHSLP